MPLKTPRPQRLRGGTSAFTKSPLEGIIAAISGGSSNNGNSNGGRDRPQAIHVRLGRQGQVRQDRARRSTRGQRERSQRDAAPPGHPGAEDQEGEAELGRQRLRQGHRAL